LTSFSNQWSFGILLKSSASVSVSESLSKAMNVSLLFVQCRRKHERCCIWRLLTDLSTRLTL
jgi:hypothetical protein